MGWTWKDYAFEGLSDEAVEAEMERREPSVKMVAEELSMLQRQREVRGFEQQRREEEGCVDEPEFESDQEAAAFRLRVETKIRLERARELALYEELDSLGARMCRPYEHWHEEEALMEYLERDR